MSLKTLAFLTLIAASTASIRADIIHVAPCGDDSWTGANAACTAPNGPKRTIQAAINASTNGDTVLVAAGTYQGPGNRDMDYGGRAITVRGAGSAHSIIDCEGKESDPHRAFHFRTGETNDSVLDGFTIQNGYQPTDGGYGGAIMCELGAPLIQDCLFRANHSYTGGVIYTGNQDLALVGCTFEDNTAVQAGGALAVDAATTLTRCTFRRNSTTNPAGVGGGAVACGGTFITFDQCVFTDNTTGRIGGAVWARGSDAALTNCSFIGNSAPARASGFGVSAGGFATLVNCLFASNTGSPAVGALWVGNGVGAPATATITNCTFAHNGTSTDTGLSVTQTSWLTATNCIYWGNSSPILAEPSASVWIAFSDIEGEWMGAGAENSNVDPLFVDPSMDNYQLAPFSPCIDNGDSDAVPVGTLTDLDGLPRFVDDPWMPNRTLAAVDMGAYEFQGGSCRVDFNRDGLVDFSDYLEFLNLFDLSDPAADLNGDGLVDFSDYLEFLNLFDEGC